MQGERGADGQLIGYKGMEVDPASNKVIVNFTIPVTKEGKKVGIPTTAEIDLNKEFKLKIFSKNVVRNIKSNYKRYSEKPSKN